MGVVKEVLIVIVTLLFGWMLVGFFTGGVVGLGVLVILIEAFPILVKPIMISGAIFGLIFLIGRHSK